MLGGFNIGPVEVDVSICGRVDEFGGETEDVPRQGTHVGDFIDVEAGVRVKGGLVDEVEEVVVGFAGVVEEYGRLIPLGGKVDVVGVPTGLCSA